MCSVSVQVCVSKHSYLLDMMYMRYWLFWGVTRRRLLVSYRRFGTLVVTLTLEGGTDRFSLLNIHLHRGWSLKLGMIPRSLVEVYGYFRQV